ncbi:amidohydrolase family protein [Geodermatophilus sp. DSM 45219]|uniref:amidohydrolase family protein n=1 Tax=Geodermatophilus sp. DSM 45219 TaxID=1881103 RepID=UPI00088C8F50|nr:amidohydrolase family protein [Geodermatophilus sp. DSM 45219]SDN72634.1 Imidazolonepropionase [Geodermatophilus sp. DSM 45219]
MRGYRAPRAFDGERFLPGGALVLVEGRTIVGVEPATTAVPDGCPVTDVPDGTLLPGLIDTHVHLCGDGGPQALEQIPELDSGQLDAIITAAERETLRAGVTTVRDLGDHRGTVLDRAGRAGERPTVVAAGPPLTSPGGHCWSMGGETTGVDALRRAVRERAERGAGVVKVMASGGVLTPGTDLTACQFTLEELRAVVDEAHRLGLPVTAHAHGLAAVERSVAAGVDGIEHCSCLTGSGVHLPAGLGAALAAAGIDVCPTVGFLPGVDPPPHVRARMAAVGATIEDHLPHVAALHRAGVALLAGTDGGIGPAKRHGQVAYAVADLVTACGVPLAEALTAATARSARACGLGERTGRLAAGYDADLLVADGDVTVDVSGLQRPRVVVARGREVRL